MTSPHDLLSDPHWFPVKLDAGAQTLTFMRTSRQALSEAPFLDQRFIPQGADMATLPFADLAHIASASPPPLHWIFHTAFCCSTLMARAMDVPGHSLTLKEPGVLMDLANARRMASQTGMTSDAFTKLTDAVFALLARRFSPDEAIIIKPTNPCNPLALDALARQHKAIFMVSDLKDFLISVLKKGEPCKAFMRTLFNIFALDPAPLGQIPQRQALTFTDLQIASLVQQHQMEFLTELGERFPGQTRAFNGNLLPGDPVKYVQAASDFFGLSWPDGTAARQAGSDVFSRNSKFADQTYGADARAEDAAEIEALHREALSVTLQWASSLTLSRKASMPPAKLLA